jgi:hypothetical protein
LPLESIATALTPATAETAPLHQRSTMDIPAAAVGGPPRRVKITSSVLKVIQSRGSSVAGNGD